MNSDRVKRYQLEKYYCLSRKSKNVPKLGSTASGTISTVPTSLPIHSTSELPTTVFLQHLEELTAVKKTADNVTINIETLTEYDKINDPPMTIPV